MTNFTKLIAGVDFSDIFSFVSAPPWKRNDDAEENAPTESSPPADEAPEESVAPEADVPEENPVPVADSVPEEPAIPEVSPSASPAIAEEDSADQAPSEVPLIISDTATDSNVDPGKVLMTEGVQLVNDVPEDKDFPFPLFLGAVLAAFVLGAVISAAVTKLIGKRSSGSAAPGHIRSLSVQGIGARKDQQDAFHCSDSALYTQQGLLMCVADGMGGLSNGSIYSRSAVSAIAGKFDIADRSNPEKLVAALTANAVSAVNRIISPNFGSGGTTLLLGYLRNGLFYYSSVGDSRICLYRDGQLLRLNRPHDFESELKLHHVNNELSFEQAKGHEKRAALTSYIGMGPLKYVDLPSNPIAVRQGDRIVLMSDGVFNTLSDDELCCILSHKPKTIEHELAEAIEAKKYKYQDNYTAVIAVIE